MITILRRLVLLSAIFSAIWFLFNGTGNTAPWISLAVILLGLAGYFVIPWPIHKDGVLEYSRIRGVIIPDMLGVSMCGFFVILGSMAISEGAPLPVFLVLASFGSLFLSINGVAAWYEAYRIEVAAEGIIRYTIFGRQVLNFRDMEKAWRIRYSMPEWMKWSAALAALVSWRSTIPLLIQKGRKDQGFRIRMKNGKVFTIWGTALSGFETIEKAVQKAGVQGISR